MSKWLDLSNNANKLRQSYVTGFIDISGGLSVRNNSSIDIYSSLSNASIPNFSINSDTMTIYDSQISSYVDISNTQLLYLKDLTTNVNTELQDLISRTKHITTDTVNIDTMLEFNSTSNDIYTYSNIIPATANTYSLGTPDKPFQSLYINQGTIHFIDPNVNQETAAVSYDPTSGNLYLVVDNYRAPLNNTKIVDGVLVTPLLSYGGNVGIGTTVPKSQLDISGSVTIKGDTVLTGNLQHSDGDINTTGNIHANILRESGQPIADRYLSIHTPVMQGDAVAPTMTVTNDLFIGGNAYFEKNINVVGDASMNGRLFANTPINSDYSNLVATTAYVQNQGYILANNSSLTGNTAIVKASVQQKLYVGGDVSFNSKLYVFDNTFLNNNLSVTGNTVSTKLIVTNDTSLNGNLTVGGNTNVPTPDNTDNSNRIATTAFVKNQVSTAFLNPPTLVGPVNINNQLNVIGDASLNNRLFVSGDATLNSNLYVAGQIIGNTPSIDNSSNLMATTAYVKNQNYAVVNSPTFTGTGLIPNLTVNQGLSVYGDASFGGRITAATPQTNNNSNLVATTAYVQNQAYATIASPTLTGTLTAQSVLINSTTTMNGDVSMNGNLLTTGNVTFNGNTYGITQAIDNSSNLLATTAFVKNQGYAKLSNATFTGPVVANAGLTSNYDVSINGNLYVSGNTVVIQNLSATTATNTENSTKVATTAYVKNQNYITAYSPILSGIPKAPTASIGDTTNQIATTEFVRNEVTSFINAIPTALDAIQQLSTALQQTDASSALLFASELAAKANLDSPYFTGNVTLPNVDIDGNLAAYGTVTLNRDLYVSGDSSFNGKLSIITPDSTENSSLVATTAYVQNQGYAKLSGAEFTGGVTVDTELVVGGNATFNQSTLLNGNTVMSRNATVNGSALFNNTVNMKQTLNVAGDSSFNGNVLVSGNLTTNTPSVSDNSTLVATTAYVQNQGFANLSGATFTGGANFLSTMNVSGDASFNSNLIVGGNVILEKNLAVWNDISSSGNIIANGSLYENGKTIRSVYATLASPTFTGTVGGITKSMVGLANVDNTSDINKPVSTATQNALNLKANIQNASFTGTTSMNIGAIANSLTVGTDMSLNGRLFVGGDLSLNGKASIRTPATSDNSTQIATTAYVQNQGYATLSGAEFIGNVTVDQNMHVVSNTKLDSMLYVGNDASFQSNIFVNGKTRFMGDATLNSGLSVSGDVSMNSRLFLNGDGSFNGNLNIAGNAYAATPVLTDNSKQVATTAFVIGQGYAKAASPSFSGSVSMGSNLTVGGLIQTNNNLIVVGDSSLNGKLSLGGDASLNGDLYVKGNTVLNGIVGMNNILNVASDASFNGGLSVLKDASFNGNVNISGNAFADTPLLNDSSRQIATTEFIKNQNYAPTSAPTFQGTVTMPTAIVSQNLVVNSDAYLYNNLYVTGDTQVGGNLIAVTPSSGDNSTKVATTAFVNNGFAPLASPTLTGTTTMSYGSITNDLNVGGDASVNGFLTAKSPAYFDNSNKVATTQFIRGQFAPLASPTFTGTASLGKANISQTLYVNGDASMNSNLYVNNTIYEGGSTLASKYATLNSPTFTGVVSGIDASMVGLNNVNNTSDMNKPVSYATQTALNSKANLASPSFSGLLTANDITTIGNLIAVTPNTNDNSTLVATTAFVSNQGFAKLAGASFTGDVSTTGSLTVTKNTTINGSTKLNGDISLNGISTAVTPFNDDNSTRVATTAFVQNQGFAKLNSPTFTGVPTAPTVSSSIATSNQLATTQYVSDKITDFFNVASTETLNAINALSTALSNTDSTFTSVLATQLSYKANIAQPSFTGTASFTNDITVYGDASFNNDIWVNNTIYENGSALSEKYAGLNSPHFTGIVYGIDASMVGLNNVNNTADIDKPVSTATLNALTLKANLISPSFVGNVDISNNLYVRGDISLNGNLVSNGFFYENGKEISTIYAPINSPTFTGTVSGITKAMVGLSNVNNTSDINKPISTATQSALNLKATNTDPSFNGNVTIQNNLIVGGDISLNGRLYSSMDVSLNGNVFVSTPSISDNSTRVATTAFVKTLNQTYVQSSGANFTGDVSINTNLYVVGDLSLSGNLYMTYQPNTIPFNALIGGLGANAMDLNTNQTVGGIKTFSSDVSMQSQLNLTGNANLGSNNIITTLYQTAIDPSSTTLSNLSLKTNNYNGTFINEFEIDKGSGNTLSYNLTDGSLNVSNDGGNTWMVLSPTIGNTKFGGMLCLSPDGRIQLKQEYSASNAGLIYVSTNWGATFTNVPLAQSFLYTNSYFGYNNYNDQTYAFSHDGSVLYFIARDANNTVALWKSTDNTYTNYTSVNTWTYLLTNCPRAIACSKDGKYVLTITGIVPSSGMYLSVSTNYGASFTRTANSLNGTWNSIAVSYSGQYQVATTTTTIYQSSDYGATWLPYSSLTNAWNFVSMSNDGKNRIATVTNGYQYASFDYGATWNIIPNSSGNWKKAVMVDLSNNNSISIYSHDGVNIYKNFYNCSDILQNTAINTDLKITPVNHYLNAIGKSMNVVKTNVFNNYVGNTPGISNTGQYILIPIKNNQTILSTNYGSTWNVLANLSGQTGYASAAVSGNGKIMYIRNGTTTYRSGNSGTSWTAYNTISVEDTLAGTALSYDGKYIVFAGKDPATSNSNIYVSNNYGISWTIGATFPTINNKFVACISSTGQYMSVLSTTSYVLVSNDYGVTWSIKYINALLTSNYICMSYSGQYQSVVSNTGIFVSSDYGNTFVCTYSGLTSDQFTTITMIGSGEYQYAVNSGNKLLYRSTDFGLTWGALYTNSYVPSNTVVSSDGTVMLYSASGDIIISRLADYSGSISQTGVSISRKGIVSSLDISVNGTITTNSLVVNQIFENGNLLGSKYATLSSPTFTGTVSGITKSMVGLGNVDNTSDINKPVSTAVQTALNLKAGTSNPTFTGLSTFGSITAGSDVSLNGRLFVGGDLSLNGKIYANYGDSTIPVSAIIGGIPVATGSFQSDISGGSRLFIAQDASLNSRVFIGKSLSVTGPILAISDVSISGNLVVNGTTGFVGDVSSNRLFVNKVVANSIYSTGDASVNGNVYVTNSVWEKGAPLASTYATIESANFTGTSAFEKIHISQSFVNERDSTMNGNLTVLQHIMAGDVSATSFIENGQLLTTKYALATNGTLNSPTITGTITGVTKAMVGLGNVDNTSDANKPISTATQTALNLKANVQDASFLGIPVAPTATAGTNTAQLATTAFVGTAINNLIGPAQGGSLNTLQSLAHAINNDASFSVTVDNSLNLKANIASPTFTGLLTAPIINASSQLIVGGDSSMNGNLVVGNHVTIVGDLSVNGSATIKFVDHSIPSTAIAFINNQYSGITVNTPRSDTIDFDDEFFELSLATDTLNYVETFYINNADLSLNGNLRIHGQGLSVIEGDLQIGNRLILGSGFTLTNDAELEVGKLTVDSGAIFSGDVSMNNALFVGGSLIAEANMAVYGIINQQNIIIDEGGVLNYNESVFYQNIGGSIGSGGGGGGGTNLGTAIVVDPCSNNVTISGPTDICGNLLITGPLIVDNNNTDFVNDVSMGNNLNVNGTVVAQSNMCVFGVISQNNLVVDENGLIVQDNMQNNIDTLNAEVNLINNYFQVDTTNSMVTVGNSNFETNVAGVLSANGLYIGDLSGTLNTGLGYGCNLNGRSNTTIGYGTGSNITIGTNNLLLGYNAQPTMGSINNEITLGNSSIQKLRCRVNAITSLSDARDKTNIETIPLGLDFINLLKPVKFDWNMRDGGLVDVEEFGFIAQELQDAENTLGTKVPNLVSDTNPDKLEASYGTLLPIMVKAIQDLNAIILKQQKEIDLLKAKLSA